MIELRELFDISYGSQLDLNKQELSRDGINFVNRSANNLGISGKIEKLKDLRPFRPGLISVALGGSILESFVQPAEFYTGQNIKVLSPKVRLTQAEKVYYCLCIRHNAYRYRAFGREANKTLDYLRVPSPAEIPDYVNRVRVKKPSNKAALPESKLGISLNTRQWRYFKLTDWFQYTRGSRLVQEERAKGSVPFITAGAENYGFKGYIDSKALGQEVYSNAITIDMFGSSFYHSGDFSCDDNILILQPVDKISISSQAMIFIAAVINTDSYRYAYGRQYRQKNLLEHKIKLPVDKSKGLPDWQFMEDYIKSLPYSSNL